MGNGKIRSIVVAVVFGYLLLVAAIFRYLVYPWNLVVVAVVLLKGFLFLMLILRASSIGARRTKPPAPK